MARARKNKFSLASVLPWLLLIGGVVGVLASLMLTNELLNSYKNPSYVPVCNLNPILSCSDVAKSSQTYVFGFPNYYVGIVSYAILMTTGIAMLAGATFKRWYWQGIQAGLTLAIGFVTWLQFQSLYRIGALCVFCMSIWGVTIPMFLYTSLYNLRQGNLPVPARLRKANQFAQRYHLEILTVWFLIIIALIFKRFWYYWSTVL